MQFVHVIKANDPETFQIKTNDFLRDNPKWYLFKTHYAVNSTNVTRYDENYIAIIARRP